MCIRDSPETLSETMPSDLRHWQHDHCHPGDDDEDDDENGNEDGNDNGDDDEDSHKHSVRQYFST